MLVLRTVLPVSDERDELSLHEFTFNLPVCCFGIEDQGAVDFG
jgi:hypothetical protein